MNKFEFDGKKWFQVEPIEVDKKVIDAFRKMTKDDLINKLIVVTLESHANKKEIKTLQTKIDKSEAYVAQAQVMIEAVMERWDHYDV